MPSRSYFDVPDQEANRRAMLAIYGEEYSPEIEKLVARGIAPLVDEASLAWLLGISIYKVFAISLKPEQHYRSFKIGKKGKSKREIHSPRTYLKVIQWWLLDNVLNHVSVSENVTGFRRGCSPSVNAALHLGANHILCMDLENFFPSVSTEMVYRFWSGLGYKAEVAKLLTSLTTFQGGLPQGAPTSPAISNAVAAELDQKLSKLAEQLGLRYSRYADDLTFSSEKVIPVEVSHRIEEVIKACGFKANRNKTRYLGQGHAMIVTGYVVNSKIQLPKKWRKRARAVFHQVENNPDKYASQVDYVRGIYGAVCTFDNPQLRAHGAKALQALKKQKQTISIKPT